jgi:hypothetical protein
MTESTNTVPPTVKADVEMTGNEEDGWKAHSLGQSLPVDASEAFKRGWMRRYQTRRPTLIYAKPETDVDWLAKIADRIDL